jgi:hypothetical protein
MQTDSPANAEALALLQADEQARLAQRVRDCVRAADADLYMPADQSLAIQ